MIAFIEALKDDTCTPKPAKLNAWVYIYISWYLCIIHHHSNYSNYSNHTVFEQTWKKLQRLGLRGFRASGLPV